MGAEAAPRRLLRTRDHAASSAAADSRTWTPDGDRIEDPELVARIRELAIPPAWEEVWICPFPRGHIQATGVDAAGRKQYLYHDEWRRRRDQEKFDEMIGFARALPDLRERVAADLEATDELTRERVLACAVRLLDRGFFRIGTEEYTVTNESLRPGDDAEAPRDDRGRRHDGLRLPRQERQAAHPGGRRRPVVRDRLRAQAPPRRRRRTCSPSRRAAAGATCAPTTSTSTSRRSPTPTSRRRTSAPGTRP